MRRLHLVELEDLSWWPVSWRDAGTTYLAKASQMSGQSKLLAPVIAEVLAASGQSDILDLCSGGGGPTATFVAELRAQGQAVHVRLTDFYPNLPAMDRVAAQSHGSISVVRAPVDAANVPPELPGLRTLFNAFHHFRPDAARAILASAVRDQRPILVVELVDRVPALLLGSIFLPLMFCLVLPMLRPFQWSWLFWTYVIPILPFWVMFDGIVSCLRIYSAPELHELTASLDAPGWTWEVRKVPTGPGVAATVLIGLPPPPSAR